MFRFFQRHSEAIVQGVLCGIAAFILVAERNEAHRYAGKLEEQLDAMDALNFNLREDRDDFRARRDALADELAELKKNLPH